MSDPFQIVGSTIAGKYRVDGTLGEGGYGVVYGGFHLLLETPVAIKLLKPVSGAYAGEQAATQQFLREARVLFSLSHPSIVRMYDVGEVETRLGSVPYVVLERLDGIGFDVELTRRKREGHRGLDAAELLAAFEPVLEALAFAHRHGVVHRDLKPSNIMLVSGESGRRTAKVLDFGTARVSAQEFSMGTTGFTPRYASPEQWDPSFGTTGPASDLFTLGLILVEAATLEPAFPGASPAQVLAAAVSPSHVLRVCDRRPDLPAALDAFVAEATARPMHQRFASAEQMLDALRAALRGAPATQAPSHAGYAPAHPIAPAPAALVQSGPRYAVPVDRTGPPLWTGAHTKPPRSSSSVWIVLLALGALGALGAVVLTGFFVAAGNSASDTESLTEAPDPTDEPTPMVESAPNRVEIATGPELREPEPTNPTPTAHAPTRPSASPALTHTAPSGATAGPSGTNSAPAPSATTAAAGPGHIALGLSRALVPPGGDFSVRFTPPLPASGARYWIAMLPVGAPDSAWGTWAYVNVDQSVQAVKAPSIPGAYELRLHDSYPRYTTHVNARARFVVDPSAPP